MAADPNSQMKADQRATTSGGTDEQQSVIYQPEVRPNTVPLQEISQVPVVLQWPTAFIPINCTPVILTPQMMIALSWDPFRPVTIPCLSPEASVSRALTMPTSLLSPPPRSTILPTRALKSAPSSLMPPTRATKSASSSLMPPARALKSTQSALTPPTWSLKSTPSSQMAPTREPSLLRWIGRRYWMLLRLS
ncbi:uncharacterized protein LOC106023203 isoform X3 [Mesocricetus auratus]|uniref:Uncharacterized protein LOC106023203 isoform X3 n=1 Tax=Mesocricetus auratus TaxID=10036 RepID=A0ABM2XBN1_MESAU|nr:uncharacterized protein LOC106023203 isoform X3 [Mesocricetus auratus]